MGSQSGLNSSELSINTNESYFPPVRHSSAGSCLYCYSPPPTDQRLMVCSQCELVSYCSKDCQRNDWRTHKKFCIINAIKEGKNIFSHKKKEQTLYEFSELQINEVSQKLERPLKQYEKDILYFPKVCKTCHKSKYKDLKACTQCHCVFYCSNECRENDEASHTKWCSEYILNLKSDLYEIKEGIQDLPMPQVIDREYTPITGDIKSYLRPQLSINNEGDIDESVETIIYDRLSYPLSLLYALQKTFFETSKQHLYEKSELKVHILGATSLNELLGLIRWEYIVHRLPVLNVLHTVFIGPDLYKDVEGVYNSECMMDNLCLEDSGMTRCSDCKESGKMVIYEMANMTYHSFSSTPRYTKPDFIIAFNPCFDESQNKDLWKPTLDLILSSNVPFAFTSYTHFDSKSDLRSINELGKEYSTVLPTEKNPFSSPRPTRDPVQKDGNDFYYCNQFITCVLATNSLNES